MKMYGFRRGMYQGESGGGPTRWAPNLSSVSRQSLRRKEKKKERQLGRKLAVHDR